MLLQLLRTRRKQVLIDINTQRHVLLADGCACIRNHRRILSHIRRVMAWARYNDIPIVSTCDLYANGNGNGTDPCHPEDCHKVRYTLRPDRISFTADNTTDLPSDVLHRFQQVIFEKRSLDPFEEPRIDRLLTEMHANEFVVIGAAAEGAVQATVLGLIQRHKHVTVISDAIGIRDMHEGKMALRKMEAKGAVMVDSKKIAGVSRLNLVGACGCDSCQRIHAKGQAVGATQTNES